MYIFLAIILLLAGCMGPRQVIVPDYIAQKALAIATEQIDKPYVWGGRGPDTFDCSGIITWSYKKAGVTNFSLGDTLYDDVNATQLYKYNIVLVDNKNVKPGDIVFITYDTERMTHCGLFVKWIDDKEFEFINASSYYGEVVIDTWSISEQKRGQWFAGFGRLKTFY